MRRTVTPTASAVCVLVVLFGGLTGGCQSNPPEMGSRLAAHVSMIDFAGLSPAKPMDDLQVTAAMPARWEAVPPQSTALFTHRLWRSGTHLTGAGIAVVHLPLPMSAKTLLWIAKAKYAKTPNAAAHGGQITNEWTDAIGREWFEAENDKYHIQGYAVTSGFQAWVVYTGYRLQSPPNPVDISLGFRAVDSVVPFPLDLKGDPSEKRKK